jgi:hypothetical protein
MIISRARSGSAVVAITLLAVIAGCYGRRSTPAPESGFERVDSSGPTDPALAAYLSRLRFDTTYAGGDEQRLMLGHYPGDAHYGPLVRIEPESGAYLLSRADLSRGRIIARMVNHSDQPYPKFGIAPHGVTYWWAELPARGSAGRSVFISTDSVGRIVSRTVSTLTYEEHPGRGYVARSSRWIWSDDDEKGWTPCGGCCKSPS